MIRRQTILLLALFFTGIHTQEKDKSIVIPEEIKSANQCYQDGYIVGNKFSIDDALIYGVSIYIPIAPITYLFVSKSHPIPINNKLENLDNDCNIYFLDGYEKGSIKRRKSAVFYGAATLPGIWFGAFLIGSIHQGKFPPDL